MFSHIHIGTHDLTRAVDFYDRVLAPLGIVRKFVEPEEGWAGWKHTTADRPLFLVGRPFDGNAPEVGNGQMVAFTTPTRDLVKTCYNLALDAGAADEGAPDLRPHYHEHYFGAYFRDLDGNKVCICCHAAP